MIKEKIKNFIPSELHFEFTNFKHTFTKFKQVYYSQNCEDVLVKSLFPKNYKGFYVDVGAHHPYRISNTYLLHKQGWSGINIDANPETIKLFKKARPNDTNLNIGISNSNTLLEYHRFSDPAVNTFSETEAEKWKQKNWLDYLGATYVQTQPLSLVLAENLEESTEIDLLSIDVEGLDLEVLKSNDWKRFRPKVVVVESHDFDIELMGEHPLYTFLNQQNYKLKFVAKFSLIFTLKTVS